MAVFTGSIMAVEIDARQLPEQISPNVLTYIASSPTLVTWDGDLPIESGTKGDTQPVDEPMDAKVGRYPLVHFDDFYYRIILTPTVYDLGNILFDQEEPVEVFNGYFVDKTMTDFTFDPTYGVDPTEPVTAPYDFVPLGYEVWDFSVLLAGPATLDTPAVWTIDGVEYSVNFTGNRVFMFSAKPNWKSGLKETIEWKSAVHRSFSGKEQRAELRQRPRLKLQYDYLLSDPTEISTLTNRVFGWSLRSFAVPRWHDRSQLTADTALNDITIYLDTRQKGFYAGGLAIIYRSALIWEVVDILTVTSASLGVDVPIRNVWPAGTVVHPLYIGQLPNNTGWQKITDSVWGGKLQFNADPAKTEPYMPVAAAPITVFGQELYLKKPNRRKPVNEVSLANVFVTDHGYGPVNPESHSGFAEHQRRYSWQFTNRDDIESFLEFLGRRKGRVVPCFMPSWDRDFTLSRDAAASENAIEVIDNGYAFDVGGHPAKRTLIAIRNDGTHLVMQVNNTAVTAQGYAELYMTGEIGENLYMRDINRISYCDLRRLRNDKVVLKWLTDGVLEVEIDFVSVIQ